MVNAGLADQLLGAFLLATRMEEHTFDAARVPGQQIWRKGMLGTAARSLHRPASKVGTIKMLGLSLLLGSVTASSMESSVPVAPPRSQR